MLEYLKFIPSLDSIDIPYLWNKDDIKYHNSVNLRPLIVQGNQENFYNKFIETLKSSDYKKEAEYLLKNIFVNSNQYTLAFAFAQTHSFSYPYHVYMKVVNRTNFSPEEIEINEGHLNYTSSALLPWLDIPNHIFPNKLNKTNLNSFKLIPKKGSIGMVIKSVIKRNEEYGFAYTPDMDSNHMLQAYGFTILNNPGELIFLQVDNIMKNFSISCLQLWVELGWIQEDSVSSAYYSFPKNDNLKEPKNLVFTLAKYELYNADLLMLWRFNKLTATQCNSSNSIKDNLRIYGYVNLYNEVYGLIGKKNLIKLYWCWYHKFDLQLS